MRLLCFLLLFANVAVFAYIYSSERSPGADAQIALLQISPEKLKLLKLPPAARREKPAAAAPSPIVCLEWGSFGADELGRAEAALATFELGDKLSQRDGGDVSYWVHIPPLKSKADVDKKTGELKALGVRDFYVIQDNSQWRFAISLGVFKTEDAANNYLAQLKQKGVRSALVGARDSAKAKTFVIRDPGDAVAAKIAELKTDFPNAQLKAAACTDAAPQAAKN